jgi:uncharacterized protein YggT (Ycf19 family)
MNMTYRNDQAIDETGEHPTYDAPPRGGDQVNVNAGESRTYVDEGPSPLALVRRVFGLIFGVMIALIGIRILLLALGANEGNALVDGIYGITEPLVAPFRGIFSMDQVQPAGRSVFDIAALVAIVGWSLIALLVMAVLKLPERRAY